MDYLAQAKSLEDRLSEIRKDLHRHPELGNEEFYTSKRIEEILKDMGLDVRRMLDTEETPERRWPSVLTWTPFLSQRTRTAALSRRIPVSCTHADMTST